MRISCSCAWVEKLGVVADVVLEDDADVEEIQKLASAEVAPGKPTCTGESEERERAPSRWAFPGGLSSSEEGSTAVE